ncbi:hypothetical protein TCAL_15960, partial [Tigriopus californicus]
KHTLTGPTVGTTDSQEEDNGLAVGDCITDSFTVKNPRAKSPPVVCGFNDGQHMIYEMSSPCSSLDFVLGGGAMARQWDIKVTQYKCHNDDIAGPSGCLQYFTQPTGRISNFNFPTTSTVVGSTVTHLSRQAYTVCIRRMAGMCSICYSPSLNPVLGSATDQVRLFEVQYLVVFGLDLLMVVKGFESKNCFYFSSKGTMALQDTACVDDFVQIPFGELDAATPMGQGIQMFCGRGFNVVPATISATVCSSYLPFQLNYAVSQNEVDKGANNEQKGFPGGIVGFSLDYFQVPC